MTIGAEDQDFFPWEDVDASRRDTRLQADPPYGELLARFREQARVCPGCGTAPTALGWIYFRSLPWTWELMVGRQGLTVAFS